MNLALEDGTLAFALRLEEEIKRLLEHNDRVYGNGRRPPAVKFRDGSYIHKSKMFTTEDIPVEEADE